MQRILRVMLGCLEVVQSFLLGVSHATSSKKNLLLMTGSFALSILLFLSFSVLLRWVGFALNPLQSYTPDLSVAETSGQNVLDPVLVEQLEALPEVKHAFGRMYCPLPAEYQGKQGSIDLISYDTIQFGWAKKDLIGRTLPQEPEDGTYPVLTVFDKSNSLTVGDTIQLEDAKLTVVGVLDDSPFSSTDSPDGYLYRRNLPSADRAEPLCGDRYSTRRYHSRCSHCSNTHPAERHVKQAGYFFPTESKEIG